MRIWTKAVLSLEDGFDADSVADVEPYHRFNPGTSGRNISLVPALERSGTGIEVGGITGSLWQQHDKLSFLIRIASILLISIIAE